MISLEDKRKELYQWDTNRYIDLGDEIADATKVHFGNGVFERSIDVPIEDKKALIPDVLLQYARPLKVWLFVGEASNGYTKVEHIFQVKARNKPSDYVFTPTEQLSLQELINKFEDFREGIGEEVEDYLKNNPISIEEKDPTVPAWAKNAKKPSYTAAEVGARSDSWLPTLDEIGAQPKGNYALKSDIPTVVEVPVKSVNGKTGEVQLSASDIGALADSTEIITNEDVIEEIERYMREHPAIVEESDPTVPAWAKQPEKPTYTAGEVGAQPKGDYALKSEIPDVPVQSVNGKTGAVQLSAADVGALPKDTPIPAPYTLPIASAETLGGVKVGKGLAVDEDGKVSVEPEDEYEPIKTVTLEAEVASVTIDVSGYKKVKLHIEVPQADDTRTAVIGANSTAFAYYPTMTNGRTNRQYAIEFVKRNGRIFVENCGGGQGGGSGLLNGTELFMYPRAVIGYGEKNIYNVIANMLAGAVFPVGSIFTLEGVRENA